MTTISNRKVDFPQMKEQLDIIESQASQVVSVMLSLLTSPRLNLTSEQIIEGRVVAAQMLRSGSGPLRC